MPTRPSKKVLIIKDSSALVTIPYFTLAFQHVSVIDLRHYKDMPLLAYVKEYQPDVVVFLYNENAVLDNRFYQFL